MYLYHMILEYVTGTETIVRLTQYQKDNPEG